MNTKPRELTLAEVDAIAGRFEYVTQGRESREAYSLAVDDVARSLRMARSQAVANAAQSFRISACDGHVACDLEPGLGHGSTLTEAIENAAGSARKDKP